MRLFGWLLLLLTPAAGFAGESVILANGARLHVDRYESDGARLRLYSNGGYLEMDASRIQGFEADEIATPAETAPAPAPVSQPMIPPPPTPQELADYAADKYGLPRKLVRSVMAAESGFSPQAISPKGAIGLMQLMPATAGALGVDPNDPAQNVDGGARYLRDLLVKYDGYLWHALAAYNAGPAAVDKYKGGPPYNKPIHYVWKIDQELKKENR